MPYDPFKHHRRSIRLRGYDYSHGGAYFVTICERNRECLFGEIVDGDMHVNRFGRIILEWWHKLPTYYLPVQLDEFVVMPNHMHGIIVIGDAGGQQDAAPTLPGRGDAAPTIGREDPAPTDRRTLGQLMGYFKFQITKEINQIRDGGVAKVFQRDYYEHIIRNDREWNAIARYIRDNPANWRADLDNPANFSKRPPPKDADEYWRDAGL